MPTHTTSERKKNRFRKKRTGFRSPGPTRRDVGSLPRNQPEPQSIARPLRLVTGPVGGVNLSRDTRRRQLS